MDARIQELIDFTKAKFGLDNYYLKRQLFARKVNIFNDTVYTLCMEWFPNHVTEYEDDDFNPEGTAVIDINIRTRKFENVIFVMGKTYAKEGIRFFNHHTNDIIKWIEQETGLTYGKQFQLHKEGEGELFFKECINGKAVSPAGFIEMKFDQEGKLILFSVHGHFPSKTFIREESYSLSLDQVEHLAKEQLKLVEIPSFEQRKLIAVYGVEEIYIKNDRTATIPFEIFAHVNSYVKIDKTIYWNEPIDEPFERKEMNWIEHVTAEQAFSCEPSPDTFPITEEEQENCVTAVKELLRREYPDDNGKWMLKTLHRDEGFIHAVLWAKKQDNRVFQRKIKVIIDPKSFQAVNYMDNKPMLETFDQFQRTENVTITKEEAYEKMKGLYELEPIYVYDFKQNQYILCGKLDCQYGVNASTGEVIALNEL
jgi:hypothetical protein